MQRLPKEDKFRMNVVNIVNLIAIITRLVIEIKVGKK